MTFSATWAARARNAKSSVGKPPSKSEDNSDSDESRSELGDEMRSQISPVKPSLLATIVVFGADGDLSSKKILPTLFNLWRRKLVPRDIIIFGFARSPMTTEMFRKHIFKCIYNAAQPQGERKEFLERCHYQSGQFNDPEAMAELMGQMKLHEAARRGSRRKHEEEIPAALVEQAEASARAENQVRLYYMAVPPFLYACICAALRHGRGSVQAAADASADAPPADDELQTAERFVLEKPFGKDTASCKIMVKQLSMLREDEIFRIDHYLGKELVMNLLVLRFANVCFQAIWNRDYIKNVQVIFKEDFGVEGRAGYFDEYGIIRDVLQNHLLQVRLACAYAAVAPHAWPLGGRVEPSTHAPGPRRALRSLPHPGSTPASRPHPPSTPPALDLTRRR